MPGQKFDKFNIIENKFVPSAFGPLSDLEGQIALEDGLHHKNVQDVLLRDQWEKRGNGGDSEFYPLNKQRWGRDVDHVDPAHTDN